MRLLNVRTKTLKEFAPDSIPPYAIFSHTWTQEEEVTFQEMNSGQTTGKKGLAKIVGCCRLAEAENLDYVWIDTCCIDKSSSSELSEAINSMYRWYEQATCCFAFLEDYPATDSDSGDKPCSRRHYEITAQDLDGGLVSWFCGDCFRNCRWFTRGWTLQELLAPTSLKFYSKAWAYIGRVGKTTSHFHPSFQTRQLETVIKDITNIPIEYINRQRSLSSASIAQRFSWASRRKTSRPEDVAYCLLGLFDVQMPLLYGEGQGKAFTRLQEGIMKVCDDQSILAWGLERYPNGLGWHHPSSLRRLDKRHGMLESTEFTQGPLLSPSPAYFVNSWNIIPCRKSTINPGAPHSMTVWGLRIDIHFLANKVTMLQSIPRTFVPENASYVALGCVEEENPYCPLTMCVLHLEGNVYARALSALGIAASLAWPMYADNPLRSVYLLQQPQSYTTSAPSETPSETICLMRKTPASFQRCQDSYPAECWNEKKGIISVSSLHWCDLRFPLATLETQALLLGFLALHEGHQYWYCRLRLISLSGSAESIRYTLPPVGTANILTLTKNGGELFFTIAHTETYYSIRLVEDLVLGSVFGLEIKESARPMPGEEYLVIR